MKLNEFNLIQIKLEQYVSIIALFQKRSQSLFIT